MKLAVIETITPTRIGSGLGDADIDIPVIRECTTTWPFLPGSSIKGVQRDRYRVAVKDLPNGEELLKTEFGDTSKAPNVLFTDMFMAMLAVPAATGSIGLVTCPLALHRLNQFLEMAGIAPLKIPVVSKHKGLAPSCLMYEVSEGKPKVGLDAFEFDFVELDSNLSADLGRILGLADWMQHRLAIVSDDSYTSLTHTCMEVRTRTALDHETGTAKDGSLRTEELVPACSVFVGGTETNGLDILEKPATMQIGGAGSIGLGIVKWRLGG